MKTRLDNETAFVVGGSSGIGAATVRALAEAGAKVAIGYFSGEERAQKLIAALPGEGHIAVQIDMADSQSVVDAVAKVSKNFACLNILVNSGATTKFIPHNDLDALDDDFFDQIMKTNVRGVFSTIRACRPLMENADDPVIISISSVAGSKGNGSNVAYGASKAALDTMTRSLALALAPKIRILTVSPGIVDTEFISGIDRDLFLKVANAEPLGRAASAQDCADAVMACITHLPMTTGTTIYADAGRIVR